MYSLLRNTGIAAVLRHELLPFAIALRVAQLFFKWGSFALELAGFLALWWVLGFFLDLALRAAGANRDAAPRG